MAHCCQVRHVSCSQQQIVLACVLAVEACRQQWRCADGHTTCSAWGTRWQFRAVLALPAAAARDHAFVRPNALSTTVLLLLLHGFFPPIPPPPQPPQKPGVYSESNFLLVHCTCAARCNAKAAPQCFGLEEWVQAHGGLQEALPDSDGELEQMLRREVQVLLDGDVAGRQVRVWFSLSWGSAALHQGLGQVCIPRMCVSLAMLHVGSTQV